MHIVLATPRGFCAGVDRAISIVVNALNIYGEPVYVYHEIVHNSYVVNVLKKRGVIFVEQINDVPYGSVLVFSAHGVSESIKKEAQSRDLLIFDATCPLVTKIHMKITRASLIGQEIILIGHAGHPEIDGSIGHYNNQKGGIYLIESLDDIEKLKIKNEHKLSFITQTTLSTDDTDRIVNALRQRFPKIIGSSKNDICYATINRQEAVRLLAKKVDVILVLGSKNSSNSNRLVEIAQRMGKNAFLIEDSINIQEDWIKTAKFVGITAGASTPDILVQNTILYLKSIGGYEPIILSGKKEKLYFKLPKNFFEKK